MGGFAVLVVLAIVMAGRFSEANKVKSAVKHQLELWNAGEIDALYATFTSAGQQICPIDAVKKLVTSPPADTGTQVAVNSMGIRIQGDHAYLTGFVTVGGRLAGQIDDSNPAVYLKTDDGWKLDSMERAKNLCGSASGGTSALGI